MGLRALWSKTMDSYQKVKDSSGWLREGFLVPKGRMSSENYRYRYLEDGLFNVADTTLGGNQAVNPAPQFTTFADPDIRRFVDHPMSQYDFEPTETMGEVYYSRIERNAVHLHMRGGVPVHAGLINWYGNFYNSDAASLVNHGKTDGIFRTIGRIIGSVATIRILPMIMFWQVIKFLMDVPSTKYYYLKPTMHAYHLARNNILNSIMSDLGMVQGLSNAERPEGLKEIPEPEGQSYLSKVLPDVYRSNGSVDFFRVGTRYQRKMNKRYEALQEATEGASTSEGLIELASAIYRKEGFGEVPPNFQDINEYLDRYINSDIGDVNADVEVAPPDTDTNEEGGFFSGVVDSVSGFFSSDEEPAPNATREEKIAATTKALNLELEKVSATSLSGNFEDYRRSLNTDSGIDLAKAEFNDGGQFISFRIDPPSMSESFSNQVEDASVKTGLNAMTRAAKNLRFNVMDGSFWGMDTVIGTVGQLLGGALDSVGFGGIAALAGNAYVDIPKHWVDSTANLPKLNAKMQLRAWSGDEVTRLQSLYYPLASAMAFALPRSTGHASWGRPLLIEYFCQGYGQSRLAIIDQMTISRAPGDFGITRNGELLAIDVEFSLLDLSSVMHMPIGSGFQLSDFASPSMAVSKYLFSDTNTYTDYVSTITGLGMVDQIYSTRRLRKNWHALTLNFEQWSDTSHWVSYFANSGFLFGAEPGRWLSAFADVTDRG